MLLLTFILGLFPFWWVFCAGILPLEHFSVIKGEVTEASPLSAFRAPSFTPRPLCFLPDTGSTLECHLWTDLGITPAAII